jgi:hypothetical protein
MTKDAYIWVSLRVDDGMGTKDYGGKIAIDVFHRIIGNQMASGWLELQSVFWHCDGQYMAQTTAARENGYLDTTYFRIEKVERIVLIDESFARSVLAAPDRTA